jgi:hypothetical protein
MARYLTSTITAAPVMTETLIYARLASIVVYYVVVTVTG